MKMANTTSASLPVGNPEDWAENLSEAANIPQRSTHWAEVTAKHISTTGPKPPMTDEEILEAMNAKFGTPQLPPGINPPPSMPIASGAAGQQHMTELQDALLKMMSENGGLKPPSIVDPKSSIQPPQYFCRKCMRVVQTETIGSTFTFDPTGNKSNVGRRRCRECHSGVVKYTVEDLGRLLHEQDALVEQAKTINEDNRTLTRTLRELEKHKWFVPATCEIISPNMVEREGNTHYKIGTTNRAYEFSEEGMTMMKVDGVNKPVASGASSEEVAQLRRQVADLKRQITQMGGQPAQPHRTQRTIGI